MTEIPLSHVLAFYWNPSKEAFYIPYFDHPVVWYGILFVTGFIFCYLLFIPIIKRFLKQQNQFAPIDIKSWPLLVDQLKSPSRHLIVKNLQDFLNKHFPFFRETLPTPINEPFKASLLKFINEFLYIQNISRDELAQLMPNALSTVQETSVRVADRICWVVILATLIGARLGNVFFYDWPYYQTHPIEIFKVWKGGLASHGAVLGVIFALALNQTWLKKQLPYLTLLNLLDFVSITAPLLCGFIRLGNFMNQEIVGTPTKLPWGVIFGNPMENVSIEARHPIQLYEAAIYFIIFGCLWYCWKKRRLPEGKGIYFGLLLVSALFSRFILEFWKESQFSFINTGSFLASQLLSLPLILLGLILIVRGFIMNKTHPN